MKRPNFSQPFLLIYVGIILITFVFSIEFLENGNNYLELKRAEGDAKMSCAAWSVDELNTILNEDDCLDAVDSALRESLLRSLISGTKLCGGLILLFGAQGLRKYIDWIEGVIHKNSEKVKKMKQKEPNKVIQEVDISE